MAMASIYRGQVADHSAAQDVTGAQLNATCPSGRPQIPRRSPILRRSNSIRSPCVPHDSKATSSLTHTGTPVPSSFRSALRSVQGPIRHRQSRAAASPRGKGLLGALLDGLGHLADGQDVDALGPHHPARHALQIGGPPAAPPRPAAVRGPRCAQRWPACRRTSPCLRASRRCGAGSSGSGCAPCRARSARPRSSHSSLISSSAALTTSGTLSCSTLAPISSSAHLFVGIERAVHVVGEAAVVGHAPVQARAHAVVEHAPQQAQRHEVGVVGAEAAEAHAHVGLAGVVASRSAGARRGAQAADPRPA